MDKTAIWYKIVDYARWTASPHNTQPWKIRINSATKATIFYDPARLLPIEDYTGCFTTVGFGMLVENMAITAKSFGYTIVEKYDGTVLDSSKKSPQPFITVSLRKDGGHDEFDKELIKNRRTSRLPFDDNPVAEPVTTKLTQIAAKYGHDFIFSTDSSMINWVLELNRDTIFYDLNHSATRNEIGRWLRYASNEAHAKNDGLWAYCMNFPGFLMYLFFNFRWVFSLPVVNNWAKQMYFRSTTGTKTVAWLSGPFKTQHDWLKAGHMLARLWLCMTKHNVYLHPFGSIITNEKSHKRLSKKFKIDESKNQVWLLMRLGQSDIPPRSLRLSINDILIR